MVRLAMVLSHLMPWLSVEMFGHKNTAIIRRIWRSDSG
jgi:hypothetical protein